MLWGAEGISTLEAKNKAPAGKSVKKSFGRADKVPAHDHLPGAFFRFLSPL
jgi:hypothetical protein